MKKELVSMICAAGILVGCMGTNVMAAEDYTQNFDSVEAGTNGKVGAIDSDNILQGFFNEGDIISVGKGILGKTGDDQTLRVSTYRNTDAQTHILMNNVDTSDLSKDFYVTTSVYIPKLLDNTRVRLGGEFYSNGTRNTAPCLFFGRYGTPKVNMSNDTSRDSYYGWYTEDNWYNVVFAFNAADKTANWYINGELFGTQAGIETLTNFGWGVRFEQNGLSNLSVPQWIAIDNFAVKNGTYIPANDDGKIVSNNTNITVPKNYSVKKRISSGGEYGTYIGNSVYVANGTTVAEVEAALSGDNVKNIYVAKVNDIPDKSDWSFSGDNANALKTTIPEKTDYITNDMKVVVVNKNDNMQLYNFVISDSSLKLTKTASSKYGVSNTSVTAFETDSVAVFKSNFEEADRIKVYSSSGYELRDASILPAGAYAVVASENGVVTKKYDIYISKVDNNFSIYNQTAVIEAVADNTAYAAGTRLPGYSGGSVTGEAVKKTDGNAIGYELQGTGLGYLNANYSSVDNTKKYFVQSFTFEAKENGIYALYNKAMITDAAGDTKEWSLTDISARRATLMFQDGEIKMGNAFIPTRDSNHFTVGNYDNNTKYKVDLVFKQPETGDKAVYMEGLYLNGEKVFPMADSPSRQSRFNDVANSGYYVFGLGTVNIQLNADNLAANITNTISKYTQSYIGLMSSDNNVTAAKAFIGNFKVYGTDKYEYIPDEETPREAIDCTVTSNYYTIFEDARIEGCAAVKGFSGTVANVLSKLDSDISTTVAIVYGDGKTEVNPQIQAKAGMQVKVVSTDGIDSKVYTLSNTFDVGKDENAYEDNTFYASKTAHKYTSDEEKFIFAAAIYDQSGKLIKIGTDNKTANTSGNISFEIEMADTEIPENGYAKIFFWNAAGMQSLQSATKYENGEFTYIGSAPVTNY